jgi:hypothetical protein
MQPFAWAGIVAVEKASASAAHPRMVLIGNTSLSLAASYSTAMFFGIVPKQLKWPLVSLDRMGVNLKTRVSPPGSAAYNLPLQARLLRCCYSVRRILKKRCTCPGWLAAIRVGRPREQFPIQGFDESRFSARADEGRTLCAYCGASGRHRDFESEPQSWQSM